MMKVRHNHEFFVAFDLSRSDQHILFMPIQDLHHFFETSQAVRKASKTKIGPGFPGTVPLNEPTFAYIWTEIFVKYVCISTTYNLYSSMYGMALTKLEMNTAVTSWKQMNAYQFPESGCCHACLCITRYIMCVSLSHIRNCAVAEKLSDDILLYFIKM